LFFYKVFQVVLSKGLLPQLVRVLGVESSERATHPETERVGMGRRTENNGRVAESGFFHLGDSYSCKFVCSCHLPRTYACISAG